MIIKDFQYLRKLAIHDHLDECLRLYHRYKDKDISWEEVQRELTDLYILIGWDVDMELVANRIDKFYSKFMEDKNK